MAEGGAPDVGVTRRILRNWQAPLDLVARLRLISRIAKQNPDAPDSALLWVFADLKEKAVPIPLTAEDHVVGRSSELEVLRNAAGLSRRHFKLRRQPNAWYVEDLGSRNGTLRNGREVEGRVPLRDGDWIEAGELLFVASLPDSSIDPTAT